MTAKGREVADMMERRKVDMLCVQESKWKWNKARSIAGGFELFFNGVDGKRNGVGVMLMKEYSKSVVEVKKVSERVINVKLEVEGVMINVISAYAPQVKGTKGDEEVMGRYGFKERNVEGQMVVDLTKRMEMAVVNTYFKKNEDSVMHKSGGRCTWVNYVLCRRCNLKEIGDCKVLAGDSVANQHQMVVCRMVLENLASSIREMLKLFQSDHRVLGHLPNKRSFSLSLILAGQPNLGGVLVVPNYFHVRMVEATVLIRTFNAAEIFMYPSPDLCLDLYTPVSG
ncbi:hypothetical protein C0J45_20200 [Silurus meridionalis]|nr:hypothetical protein C0J45_20200 [Silurus meridionalis]